jgi:hypothetical protein
MELFIILLENVNKPHTSAGSLSLTLSSFDAPGSKMLLG